jgi:hypothetical protein
MDLQFSVIHTLRPIFVFVQVPCLDLSQPEEHVAAQLRQACFDTGFFYGNFWTPKSTL